MNLSTRHQHRHLEILVGFLALVFSMSGILLFLHREIFPVLLHGEARRVLVMTTAFPLDVVMQVLMPWLFQLHRQLLMGDAGAVLGGLSGLAIATVSTMGIRRWTGWKRIRSGFTIRVYASPRILNFDVHNTAGFFAFFFLLSSGLTGCLLEIAHLCEHSPFAQTILRNQRYQSLLRGLTTLHTGNYSTSPALLSLYLMGNLLIVLVALSGIRVGLRKKDWQIMHGPWSRMRRFKNHAIDWLSAALLP